MLRKILLIAVLIAFVAIAAIISYANPEPVSIDVGIMRFERVSVALALSIAFALGWVLGSGAAGFGALKSALQRRRLKKNLTSAESRLKQLESQPLKDAD